MYCILEPIRNVELKSKVLDYADRFRGVPMRKVFFFIFLTCVSLSAALPSNLKEKFSSAQAGDFIVTAQEGHYSLLSVRSITADTLLLEEITIPSSQVDLKKVLWDRWVLDRAPGHTAWTLYEIDRKSDLLIECFSVTKNGWLCLGDSEQLFARLMTLPLSRVATSNRKKIGMKPPSNEPDTRALWNPSLTMHGKKREQAEFTVMTTKWPDDGSPLALCSIDLYFANSLPEFPFPFWLEIKSSHYAFKLRAIDAGKGLISPLKGAMPHRIPTLVGLVKRGDNSWTLKLKAPSYYKQLQLFVVDTTGTSSATLPLPSTLIKGKESEEVFLEVALKDLKQHLEPNHRYRWVVIPEGIRDVYVESEEVFTWNPA